MVLPRPPRPWLPLIALLAFLFAPGTARAYSVLSHEQVVDLVWDEHLKPILLAKYADATPEVLRKAHAYAYGGCMLPDLGYYPFGNKFFSDLTHYVRSGDFVLALLSQAHDINEYAFALGALAHYASDVTGHPTVNSAVAVEFPKLRAKFGDKVTYAENPKAHIRTEFGFDVLQVAKGRYTAQSYHDFIGFEVAKPLLERAFLTTYGLELKDVISDEDLALGTFRRSVSRLIPALTRVAIEKKKDEIIKENPTFNRSKFLYNVSRAQYERDWGKKYRKSGFGIRVLAAIVTMIPKVGWFKALDAHMPNPQTEDMYLKSVNETLDFYRARLAEAKSEKLSLANVDFDTGRPTVPGEYSLADSTYGKLVNRLADGKFARTTPELRGNILQFYRDPKPAPAKKPDAAQQRRLQLNLETLRALPDAHL